MIDGNGAAATGIRSVIIIDLNDDPSDSYTERCRAYITQLRVPSPDRPPIREVPSHYFLAVEHPARIARLPINQCDSFGQTALTRSFVRACEYRNVAAAMVMFRLCLLPRGRTTKPARYRIIVFDVIIIFYNLRPRPNRSAIHFHKTVINNLQMGWFFFPFDRLESVLKSISKLKARHRNRNNTNVFQLSGMMFTCTRKTRPRRRRTMAVPYGCTPSIIIIT